MEFVIYTHSHTLNTQATCLCVGEDDAGRRGHDCSLNDRENTFASFFFIEAPTPDLDPIVYRENMALCVPSSALHQVRRVWADPDAHVHMEYIYNKCW